MAKYFIIGSAGDDKLWLVNTQDRSVQELDSSGFDSEGAAEAGFIDVLQNMRKDGQVVLKGINVAIATNDRTGATTQSYSTSRGG